MAKQQARNLQRSSLLDLNGTPYRLAWLVPTDGSEKEATELAMVEGMKKRSILARLRETKDGWEGYAVKSKTPHALKQWTGAWRVMEIPTEKSAPEAEAAQ